jgi:OmcA/MtrC family decaheme c-type cytochrome
LLVACLLAGSLALAGCSGDDGDVGLTGPAGQDGVNGTNGSDGLPGQDGDDGVPGTDGKDGFDGINGSDGATKLLNAHAVTDQVDWSNAVVSTVGDDVVITFSVTVDGEPKDNFITKSSSYRYAYNAARENSPPTGAARVRNSYERFTIATTAFDVVSNGSGNYTVTLPGMAAVAGTADTSYMIRLTNGATPALTATIMAHSADVTRDVAGNEGCIGCHGNYVFAGGHHGANPKGVEACVVCHTRYNSQTRGEGGDRLTAYVHGIHNAHNMPSGEFAKDEEDVWHTTYPTYMQNCSVCHNTPERLDLVNNAPVSFSLCMSCHDNWDGFSFSSATAAPFKGVHASMTAATPCANCHEGNTAPASAKDFHNGQMTERNGLIWDGQDMSVTEGAKVDMQITGVTRTAAVAPATEDSLVITWTASYNDAPVNPCNTTVSTTAPIFHAGGAANAITGQASSNMSFLRAYGQGGDWVNAGIGTSPGQPVSTNVTTSNTVCADNVATTTIAMTPAEHATTAVKGVVALQGKPQVGLSFNYVDAKNVIQVRAKTPTREFVVASGALPAETRRAIIDTDACLKCHVGSLYQHGGNRIDNVDMCVMCHNEASSEQNVRLGDGVTAANAYDGKAGQTYGFKSLLHAVHSAGVSGAITMVYRTHGIYVWAGHDTVIPNWPTDEDGHYLSGVSATVPGATAARTHNLHVTTYPQTLKNCQACHLPGSQELPDQSKAVATTLDAGAAPWSNQLDDTLQGPAMAACMSCHQSNELATQAGLQAHAKQFGWAPTTSANGRADFLNYSRGVETCYFCHQEEEEAPASGGGH